VDGSSAKTRNKQIREAIAGNAWTIVNWEQLRVKKESKLTKTKIYDPMTGEVLRIAERKKEVEVMREPLFESTKWIAAIADEAHRAKNRKSLQTKGLWRVDAQMKMALTGTPLMNTPDELWPILKWLYPKEYTSYWRFFDQYVDYYEGQFGKIITGVKNADALRFELKDRLVRRTKDDVLDLPEKVRQYIPVTLGAKQRKLYEEAETQMWFEVEQAIKEGDQSAIAFAKAVAENPTAIYSVANGAARTVRLRMILSSPALLGGEDDSAKLDAVEQSIVDGMPAQRVVWTEFVGTTHLMVKRLEKHGIRAVSFTGELTSQERTEIENAFQVGEIDVIIGTIAAMKEGITLTAAYISDWIERHWTPAVNEQGEDRQHRIGQLHPVLAKIYEAEGTIDTQNVAVRNAIKSLIVEAVVKKDHVEEIRVPA
jgi:SNF2 family DNA or RNA helicase